MKSNWTQILVFTMLALVLGFILGRVTAHSGQKKIQKRVMMKHMDGDKADMEWEEDGMHGAVFKGDDDIQVIVNSIEDSEFEGDTIINIPGGEVRIKRSAGEMEVQVEVEDSKE